ncbi:MAG: poly-gamma-glutamate synthase PgsB [Clostridia bacterium]|nr:poly-gamma-glutamate synthase PgsB [Clostridia bacterium]
MKTYVVLIIIFVLSSIFLVLGILEKRRNERNLKKIPIRVNVNGIRGKSTATRLITAVLQEAGYKAIGKTTGTAARLFRWDSDEEQEIPRKPHGVSLKEQLEVIDYAARSGANALVCECMAVKPEYQKVYQRQMLKSTVTVIVNVLEDHLDEMGPTTRQIAWAFAETIPFNGIAVLPDCEFTGYFIKVAKSRNSRYYVVNDKEITQEYLDKFSYKLFDHNCAVALTVARALGIPDDTAYSGMLKARPDPGALCVHHVEQDAVFVNGFAANEPSSTFDILNVLVEEGYDCSNPIIIMNCRRDRVDRTQQFVRDFLPYVPNASILVIGQGTRSCERAYRAGRFPEAADFKCIEGEKVEPVMEYLRSIMRGRLILGVGNIHGIGEEFLNELLPGGYRLTTKSNNPFRNVFRKTDISN